MTAFSKLPSENVLCALCHQQLKYGSLRRHFQARHPKIIYSTKTDGNFILLEDDDLHYEVVGFRGTHSHGEEIQVKVSYRLLNCSRKQSAWEPIRKHLQNQGSEKQ